MQIAGPPRRVVEPSVLDSMTDLMRHRGPSDRGTYVAPGIALGVRRLSIVDVEGGHQPFSNEDESVWAIQNGELYNHAELRARIAGHSFTSRCDTEILPHLYEECGDAVAEQLRGMFAIAIWDERKRRLVVARDRLGVKPLYYAAAGDLLVFASELKSLIASGIVDPELDAEAVDAYLTLGYFPTPYTPIRGVRKLPPGHLLVVEDGAVATRPYWTYPRIAPEPMSLDAAAQRVLAMLDESVAMRLMSDVPLGAMLSGGLDSSVIVALMRRHMDRPVTTFSVGFAEDPGNELGAAREIARALGTDHHELELSLTSDAVDLDELVWYLDEPLADLSSIGFYALSRLAAQHVTVALSGQGADELFGGYAAHKNAAVFDLIQRLPGAGQALSLAARSGSARLGRAARIVNAPNATERFLVQQALAGDEARRRLYAPGFVESPGRIGREVVSASVADGHERPFRAAMHIHPKLALVDDMLQYFDRASMAHSLEVRVPFLDHPLVEFAATIPDRHKVRRRVTKLVLKEAARGLVPDDVIARRKVGFFNAAMAQWIEAQGMRQIEERVLVGGAATASLFDRAELGRMAAARDGRHSRLLVAILMLELWLADVLPRAKEAATKARGYAA